MAGRVESSQSPSLIMRSGIIQACKAARCIGKVRKEEVMKKWVAVALSLVLLVSVAGIGGCARMPNRAPMPPFTGYLSFPDGAPPLGQTAELIYVVEARAISIHNMTVQIDLPEGFELVSGDLSWVGDVPEGDEVEVIKGVVKSVKVGNWTIKISGHLDPEENAGYGGYEGDGWVPVYVAVSEDSAEWGEVPPWYEGGGVEIPPERVGAPFSGIKVDLSIHYAPVLNEAVDLTCAV